MDSGRSSSFIASSSVLSEQQMNIYLKIIKTLPFKVKKSDSIADLKALFREKEGISEHFQEIFFSGERLNDEQNLIDCGIQENSTLNLYVENSGVLKLFITIISKGKTVEIEAKNKETIEYIKTKVCSKEGINLSHQFSLFYAGTLLDNSRTLASLGIKGNSTLHLFSNPRDVLPVSVEFPDGKIVKTEVKILFTIADLKALISSIAGFRFGDQCLSYEGKELEDSKTLAYYDLKEDSLLKIIPCNIQIFVKIWSGKTITLCVQEKDNICSVKQGVFRKLSLVPNEYHSLAFGGSRLEDSRDLASYGIIKQSTLHMVFNPRTFFLQTKLSEIVNLEQSQLKSTTVLELKRLIQRKWDKPIKEVVLYGQILKDQYPLWHYAIHKDTVFSVHFQ